MTDPRLPPLRIAPDLRVRPWAGARLAPADQHIGEAWLAGPASVVLEGPYAGRTLGELAHDLGFAFIGDRGMVHGRAGFPLLVKLIDAAEWLSIQVHPDDAQALALEGEPGIGKSELWLVLDAGPGAEILLGPAAGVASDDLAAAIGTAALPERLARVGVAAGDRIGVPPGTLHAIGPGVFVYEIQQPSDITYRAWDWGRTGRAVHTEQSLAVTDPQSRGSIRRPSVGELREVVASSPYFEAVELRLEGGGARAATDGRSPHVITVVDGSAKLVTASGGMRLDAHDTVVLPANLGEYRLDAAGRSTAIRATVP